MPVNSRHPEYDLALPEWIQGRDAKLPTVVKARGQTYLPRLGGPDPGGAKYARYLLQAVFPDFVSRTIDAFIGLLFHKPLTLDKVPLALEQHLRTNIDGAFNGIEHLAKQIANEMLLPGRYGLWVDLPDAEEQVLLRDQGRTPLPVWIPYEAERIINWQVRVQNSQVQTTRVVLQETQEIPDPADEFVCDYASLYRVLELNELGQYQVRVFQESALPYKQWSRASTMSSPPVQLGPPLIPLRMNAPLSFIPFVFFNSTDLSPSVRPMPMSGLVDASFHYYRTSADLENGRHWSGNPTPVIADDESLNQKKNLAIGGSQAILLGTGGSASFLAFSGGELSSLETALQEKTDLAAAAGSRLLTPQRRAVETAEALRIRQGAETATLASISGTEGAGLTRALQYSLYWLGYEPAVILNAAITLNNDFTAMEMDSSTMLALTDMLLKGVITPEVFIWNLIRG